jgi:hypothetical protein
MIRVIKFLIPRLSEPFVIGAFATTCLHHNCVQEIRSSSNRSLQLVAAVLNALGACIV